MPYRFSDLLVQRGRLALVALLVLSASVAGQPSDRERISVPEQSKLDEARQLAGEVYGAEYKNARTPAQLQLLAGKLRREASQMDSDPAGRFVMFKLAADVAVRAGDGRAALGAVEEIAQVYDVDGVAMKTELLLELADVARSRIQQRTLALRMLPIVAEAIAEDNYEAAERLCRMAKAAAQKGRDGALANRITALGNQVNQTEREYRKVEAAFRALDAAPTDPDANLRVGRYLCLVKGDWAAGVPMLALGSDAQLKAAAVADLQEPDSADAQGQLGDQWWQLAEEAEDSEKTNLQIRAAHWYRQALPTLGGLTKAKVEKRLEEVPERAASSMAIPTPWVRLVNLNSGLCLSVRGASKAEGAKICQHTFQDAAGEQQWEIVPLDPQWGAILNRHSDQALAVPNDSGMSGANLVQLPFDGTSKGRQWRMVPLAPGVVGVLNRGSGQALAVAYGATHSGATICQWPFDKNSEEHQWRIEPVVY
jgi:hypothetical protein